MPKRPMTDQEFMATNGRLFSALFAEVIKNFKIIGYDERAVALLNGTSDALLAIIANYWGASESPSLLAQSWSQPTNAEAMLHFLGVVKVDYGPNHNKTDGECDIEFESQAGHKFRLRGNYYDDKCYVPAIRWALLLPIEGK